MNLAKPSSIKMDTSSFGTLNSKNKRTKRKSDHQETPNDSPLFQSHGIFQVPKRPLEITTVHHKQPSKKPKITKKIKIEDIFKREFRQGNIIGDSEEILRTLRSPEHSVRIIQLETFVLNNPNNYYLHLQLGIAYEATGDNLKAIEHFRRSFELYQHYASAVLLANLYRRIGCNLYKKSDAETTEKYWQLAKQYYIQAANLSKESEKTEAIKGLNIMEKYLSKLLVLQSNT